MSEEDRHSQTEDATEKKLRDAIEQGNVPASRDANALVAIAGLLAVTTLVLPRAGREIISTLAGLLDRSGTLTVANGAEATNLLGIVADHVARFLAPTLIVLMIGGVLASVLQNPPRLVPTRIAPDLSRISLSQGARRLLGPRGATEFIKALAKTLLMGCVVAGVLRADSARVIDSLSRDPGQIAATALLVTTHLLTAILLVMAVLVAADIVWSRRHWKRDLRMSRHEIREEHRQAEGDPLVRARLRSIALDRARRRMIANVSRATLVVTNPTHFAVALRYTREEGGAPLVVAKGQDLIALKIRESARAHDIPIVENKPLARALYEQVEVDRMIPSEFYRAVAEILNTLNARAPRRSLS